LDLVLPDVDGFAILDTLHRDVKLRDIPVIVFSAKTLSDTERDSIQANIRQILEKSTVDGKTFADIIKNELS
jgi:CheY-like chemotaxis protein